MRLGVLASPKAGAPDVLVDKRGPFNYDGDGNRVLKSNPGASNGSLGSVYWYGPDGSMTDETTVVLNGTNARDEERNFYFDGKLVARQGFPTSFYPSYFVVSDQVGNTRVTVDFRWNFAVNPTLYAPTFTNYFPYGGYLASPADNIDQRFTGKIRDTESGDDYFGARYFTSSTARFLSPDNISNDTSFADPQSLNLYRYARNNPLRFVDPNGESTQNGEPSCYESAAADEMEAMADWQNAANMMQAAQQQVSQAGQDFIKGYEKLRLSPYDANPGHNDMTIGYGHKIKKGETFGTIKKAEAETLFAADVATMASHVRGDLKVSVTQNQFDALVSLRFNSGPFAVTPPVSDLNSTGHATMTDFTQHYITMGGVFSQGLLNRRTAEWKMFSEGIYDSTH